MKKSRWVIAAVLAPMALLSVLHTVSPPGTSVRRATAAEENADRGALAIVTSPDWSHGKFSHFTPAELAEMASRCELRWQMPPFSAERMPSFANDSEHEQFLRTLADERTRYVDRLHELHRALTGEPGPDDVRQLSDSLRAHPDADGAEIRSRLAHARAGQGKDDGHEVYADYLRDTLSAADQFEAALATTLGPERARALVDSSSARHTLTGCDEETGLYRSER